MHVAASGFRDETVNVWNHRLEINVKIAGSGPPLLFLHSAAGPRWGEFLDRVGAHHTIYAPELPGTSAADPHAIDTVENFADLILIYEEVVCGMGIEGAPAIGESLGGMIACDLAAHFRSLLSKLVLIAPAGLWSDDHPPPVFELMSSPPELVPEFLFFDHEGEVATEFFALPEDPEQIPPLTAWHIWAQGCSSKFLWPIPDQGLAKRLHRVCVPTLIIFGREDRLVPSKYGQEFHKRIACSRLEVIERCGHIPHIEQLDRTYELVEEFLGL